MYLIFNEVRVPDLLCIIPALTSTLFDCSDCHLIHAIWSRLTESRSHYDNFSANYLLCWGKIEFGEVAKFQKRKGFLKFGKIDIHFLLESKEIAPYLQCREVT
jgi:hypothetical protein